MGRVRFDRILGSAIMLLALGGLGGSQQPSRLLLVAIGIPALVMLVAWRPLRSRVKLGAALVALALMVSGALSLAWTPALTDGASLLMVVSIGLLAVPIACLCNEELTTVRRLRDAWSWAMAATLPLAVYELLTGEHFAYALDERNLGGEVGIVPFASVFFGNYNNYCVFISLALPMMFGTLEACTGRIRCFFWFCCIVLTFVILAVNTNRLSMIFAAAVLAYYLVTRRTWRLPFALVCIVAAVVVSLGFFDDALESIVFLITLKFDALVAADESVGQRVGMITAGLSQLADSFGLGFGVGSFEQHLRVEHSDLIPNAHNLIIELATNFGAVATLAFLAFLVQLFVTTWRGSLPRDLRAIILVTVPFVPAIGAINSQAVGYTYWWLWLATVTAMAAAGEGRAPAPVLRRMPVSAPVGCGPAAVADSSIDPHGGAR